jgi:ornithine cyclodeaminase
VVELGEITAGTMPGRCRDTDVTVCDLTGTGVQDTAIALHAFAKATERGFGTIIET